MRDAMLVSQEGEAFRGYQVAKLTKRALAVAVGIWTGATGQSWSAPRCSLRLDQRGRCGAKRSRPNSERHRSSATEQWQRRRHSEPHSTVPRNA